MSSRLDGRRTQVGMVGMLEGLVDKFKVCEWRDIGNEFCSGEKELWGTS